MNVLSKRLCLFSLVSSPVAVGPHLAHVCACMLFFYVFCLAWLFGHGFIINTNHNTRGIC